MLSWGDGSVGNYFASTGFDPQKPCFKTLPDIVAYIYNPHTGEVETRGFNGLPGQAAWSSCKAGPVSDLVFIPVLGGSGRLISVNLKSA